MKKAYAPPKGDVKYHTKLGSLVHTAIRKGYKVHDLRRKGQDKGINPKGKAGYV